MERYICVHGHFYQPPRENPWLEAIELQDSAYPFHDWNERITAECYGPNAASRILDGGHRIVKILNNYSRISFNFGPTLLTWLEGNAPEVYQAVLQADRDSQKFFSGHGSALAQAYSHMIMPLANRRDKTTQVIWGIEDFVQRFGRRPEGMWLPETAVDLETLDILAEQGLKFTILTQYQAARVRKMGARKWDDVVGGHIDPTMPYEIQLKSGRKLALFFYDGPISRAIAFERLLTRGEDFAYRLLHAFSDEREHPQLVHIATDGETYGHHHQYADMGLAYALDYIQSNGMARLTNYGEFLERFPPTHQVEITENTAWSCAHGIGRWERDCGCNSGGRPGWNQAWRAPLREALDWLRDSVEPLYEQAAGQILADPWKARDNYISVILDRSPKSVGRFLERHATGDRKVEPSDTGTVLKLLELQRHAMLMYTSCGWFFDDLSGIETVQVIQYAGRVVQLAQDLFGDSLEDEFLRRLEKAKSNLPEHGDGRHIYNQFVKPAMIDLTKVAAHYAASALFENYGKEDRIYCYHIDLQDYQNLESGRARLAIGRARVTSRITRESAQMNFACLHLGDHNLAGGVRRFTSEGDYATMAEEITRFFQKADFPETIRRIDRSFLETTFSLKTLFRDEQRKILNQILESTLAEAESAHRQLYQNHTPLMRFMVDLEVPIPTAFKTAAEVILNSDLRRALAAPDADPAEVAALLDESAMWHVQLDTAGLGYTMTQSLENLARALRYEPEDATLLKEMESAVDLAHMMPFAVDVSMAQNVYYDLLHRVYPEFQRAARQSDPDRQAWVEQFLILGRKLSIRVET
jgi:alpha-amylase/alpha-mannosidase (GH57 family)